MNSTPGRSGGRGFWRRVGDWLAHQRVVAIMSVLAGGAALLSLAVQLYQTWDVRSGGGAESSEAASGVPRSAGPATPEATAAGPAYSSVATREPPSEVRQVARQVDVPLPGGGDERAVAEYAPSFPAAQATGISHPASEPTATAQGDDWFRRSESAVPDSRPVLAHMLRIALPAGQSCRPRISAQYGVAGGIVSDALTRPGNPNCVQATYGDLMTLTIEPCGGQLVEISQIEVTRGAFRADGRRWTYPASLSYSLIAEGQETLPLPLGTGGYATVQTASFSPVKVSAVKVILRSPRTRAYEVYQRICSIVVR